MKRYIAKMEKVACPICGNLNPERVTSRGQFGLPCFVSICQNDGMVFLSPRWKSERYSFFYQNEYDSFYRPEILGDETDENKYSSIRQIVSRISETGVLISDFRSVLDIGAGMGWGLDYLSKNYSQLETIAAIESSDYCLKNIQGKIGAEVITTDVENSWATSLKFDLIIMRHVFEHFLDLEKVLLNVLEHLTDSGVLYVEVPDMMNPKGALSSYWFRAVHTYYFSKNTLIDIFYKAGYSPILIGSENSDLWGIFKKRINRTTETRSQKLSGKNTYLQQTEVIKMCRRRSFFADWLSFYCVPIKRILPFQFKEVCRRLFFSLAKRFL